MRTATGREHFASQDSGVPKSFILIISNEEKILGDVNVVVRRQVKKENSSLPVARPCLKNAYLSSLMTPARRTMPARQHINKFFPQKRKSLVSTVFYRFINSFLNQ